MNTVVKNYNEGVELRELNEPHNRRSSGETPGPNPVKEGTGRRLNKLTHRVLQMHQAQRDEIPNI
jgi:hypothetical protein